MDTGRTTTSLSANQKIQFARTVSLKVTFASYGLLEALLVRLRWVGCVELRGGPGGLPYPSEVGSIVGDSVASQSRFSMPTVTGLTVTAVSGLRHSCVTILSSSHEGAVINSVNLEDVPLAVLVNHERVSRAKEKKKVVDP